MYYLNRAVGGSVCSCVCSWYVSTSLSTAGYYIILQAAVAVRQYVVAMRHRHCQKVQTTHGYLLGQFCSKQGSDSACESVSLAHGAPPNCGSGSEQVR